MGVIPPDYFLHQPSSLPPGGTPAMDREYETWLRATCDTANRNWLDSYWPLVPDRDLVRIYQLSNHLFKYIMGCSFPSGNGPNFLHRLRLVSIQFHFRKVELVAEAERYLSHLVSSATHSSDAR